MNREQARQLEVRRRRPVGGAVLHPDQCEQIQFHGAPFYIRPLRRPGVAFVPDFYRGKIDVHVDANREPEGDLAKLAKRIAETVSIEEADRCPECGRPRKAAMSIDLDAQADLLRDLCDYAAQLLRQQYEVTNLELTKLLSFTDDGLPEWMAQLVRHAMG